MRTAADLERMLRRDIIYGFDFASSTSASESDAKLDEPIIQELGFYCGHGRGRCIMSNEVWFV